MIEMQYDLTQVLRIIISGIMLGVLIAISAVSLAVFIYNGELSPYLLPGLTASLIGAATLSIVVSFFSSSTLSIAEPQDIFAIILALIAPQIAITVAKTNPDQVISTLVATTLVMSLFLGLSMLLIALLRGGSLVRYVPYAVIGGFLAGTGWLIFAGTFAVLTPYALNYETLSFLLDPEYFSLWIWPLLYGLLMVIAVRFIHHFLVFPVMLILSLIVFYGFLLITGTTYEQALANAWMMGPFPLGELADIPTVQLLSSKVHWEAIYEHSTELVSLASISVISLLMNTSSFEIIAKRDININKELKVTGFANMLSGLMGGFGGFHSLSTSIISYKLGNRSRWVGIIAGLTVIAVLFLETSILAVLPRFVFASILFFVAFDFFATWLIDSRKKIALRDYLIILSITFIIILQGLLMGLLIGMLLSLILFFVKFSRIKVIQIMANAQMLPSIIDRNEHDKRILREESHKILIPIMSGYLFFGNAARIVRSITNTCLNAEARGVPVRFVIMDFSNITGLEASCIMNFIKLLQFSKNHHVKVVMSSLDRTIKVQIYKFFKNEGDYYQFTTTSDLEEAIEWCEERLLKEVSKGDVESTEDLVARLFPDIENIPLLLSYFEELKLQAGDEIIQQGDQEHDLYVLSRGSCNVYIHYGQENQTLLRKFLAGTIIGEMSLYSKQARSASVICESESTFFRLSVTNYKKMKQQDPVLAEQFDLNVIHHLTNRINQLNGFVNFIKSKMLKLSRD